MEMVGLGPGPFCGMLLADMGAEVLRVDRVDAGQAVDRSKPATSAMDRGKQAIAVDLKHPDGVETMCGSSPSRCPSCSSSVRASPE